MAIIGAVLVASTLAPATPAVAQTGQTAAQRARAQRAELDRIRKERADLEIRAAELQSSAHDMSEEVTNLERRADATARLVSALEKQLAAIAGEVNEASANLVRAQTELIQKRAIMHRRLAEIYKRGPVFTTQALLSARSFGDLIARYKYLHLLALRDRALVDRVEQLRDRVARDRNRLVTLQQSLEYSRSDKALEEDRLRGLERQRSANLAQVKRSAKQTEEKLAKLKLTETQLTNAIALLEAERRRAEAAPGTARGRSSISTRDYGKLDWPVQGPLLYTFGKAQTASNTTIRWNGVGIEAPVGTAVRSVADGRVVSVRQLGTYGLTIIVDHGGGDYSIYGSLSRADVREQQNVVKGQVLGGVGISDPDLSAHLHFEIRHGGPAVDPATWLSQYR